MERLPRKKLHACFVVNVILPLSLLALAGCGMSVNGTASLDHSPSAGPAPNSAVPIAGHVGGDDWQVRDADIQLYAVGTTGAASAASPLLSQPVETDSSGNFKITETYACPSPASQLYLIATGGTPVPGPATHNQAIALMTMLGPCNGLSAAANYPVNEVTTIGSVWPLSPYMASATQLGSNPNDQSLKAAITLVNQLVNLEQAASPGVGVPAGEAVQTAKLYTLANDFHACVLSAGGEAGDGSPCGQLFGATTTSAGVAPTNTIDAALHLAQANQLNLEGLFQMVPGNVTYQPVLLAPPASWDLKLVAIPTPPSFSPPAGEYAAGQQIVLSTPAAGAAIYYTTDGSQPSPYSSVYEGPLVLSSTVTINAVSMTEEISSSTATAAFSSGAHKNLEISPSQVSLLPSQSQAFMASLPGSHTPSITWSISPAVGTISGAGVYTAPASITNGQTVTVTASSASNSVGSAHATVSLTPPAAVKVAISPASVSLSASQTQQFTATVTGAANTNVTWSLSPAVGAMTAAGLYTAPASIPSAQTVTVTATSSASPGVSATATVTTVPAAPSGSTGTTYYLAPAGAGGKDSNSGLLATAPWLTPNHPLNCGDVIVAAAGTSYSSGNFISGDWGTVSCPSGNKVAWLKCAQFDACKITANAGQPGIYVDKSYWGVQGWEVAAPNSSSSFCFGAAPNYLVPVTVHHIIFANNVANGCQQGGFTTFNTTKTASADYISIIGNIAYNAAQNGHECFSGISIYQPIQSDSLPGTHIFVAGNFSYGNVDANPCGGGIPTDGEGLIFDTFDGDQGGLPAYAAQAMAENNIFIGNGGRGLQVGNNSVGSGPFATIYVRNNTLWGNNGDRNQNTNAICGELSLFRTVNTSVSFNLAETNQTTGCGQNAIYALYVWGGNGTDIVSQNWAYAVSGTTSSGSYNSAGFSFQSNNTFGTNAQFANPLTPGAPNCSSFSSAPACMAATIANFKPKNSAAAAFGYQPPSSTPAYDPLFPQWMCTASLPAGLVTVGCSSQSAVQGTITLSPQP